MNDELGDRLEAQNFLEALPLQLTEALKAGLEGLQEAGYDIAIEANMAEPMTAETIGKLVGWLAYDGTAILHELGDEAPSRLAASVYVFQSLSQLINVGMARAVPGDKEGIADYRAHLIIAGWMCGMMYGGLTLDRADVFKKAALYDLKHAAVVDGGEKGREKITKRVEVWEAKAIKAGQDALDAEPDIKPSGLIHRIKSADPKIPKSDHVDRKVRAWLIDGTLRRPVSAGENPEGAA